MIWELGTTPVVPQIRKWLRGVDLNHRPLGYEANRKNDSIIFQRLDGAGNDRKSMKRPQSRVIGPQSDHDFSSGFPFCSGSYSASLGCYVQFPCRLKVPPAPFTAHCFANYAPRGVYTLGMNATQRVLLAVLAIVATISALFLAERVGGPVIHTILGPPAGFHEDFTSRSAYGQSLLVQTCPGASHFFYWEP